MSRRSDILVIGAGMAGISLAAELAPHAAVRILEAESQPAYHSTGRSAAFWSEIYGGPGIQPLTTASGSFLAAPPPDFADQAFLKPRGAVHIARNEGEQALDALQEEFSGTPVSLEPLDRAALESRIGGLRPGWDRALAEPSCSDIDVAALHAAYLRRARRSGALLVCDARVEAARRVNQRWQVESRAGRFEADLIVNAAGAWADPTALLAGEPPLGISPFRRTLAQLRLSPAAPPELPLVIDALGRFYFKPEAGGRLWLSPHDETRSPPCDCAPEDEDVAIAIDRLEQVVDWRVEQVERRWAGLRSFAPDRLPVYGFGQRPGFFWFAGQGGFGIQTAPAAASLAASLVLNEAPTGLAVGLDPSLYRPTRRSLSSGA